jgi:hypothetical protein
MNIVLDSVELSAELLEPLIDTLTDNQILKDVPVLGSAVKIAMLGKTITDRIFLAKVRRFLTAIDPATVTKARKFAEELASGEEDAVRTAEVLILALDEINDLEKAPILAALFAAFLSGEITKADFRRITAAVNSAVADDLLALAALGSDPSGSSAEYSPLIDALRHTGLTGDSHDAIIAGDVDLAAAVSPLGKSFVRAIAQFRDSQK